MTKPQEKKKKPNQKAPYNKQFKKEEKKKINENPCTPKKKSKFKKNLKYEASEEEEETKLEDTIQ